VATARRTRNSRGTKEAKKRRDMRRNRRKLAAQLLDQQISQAVEGTLTKVNFPLPPQPPRKVLLAPVPIRFDDAPLSQPAHLPLTPPELPMPEFSPFDLRPFFPTATPLSPRTPSPFRALPRWCPKIPSLTLGDVWRDTLPTFHDLSGLPEPIEVRPAVKKLGSESCRDVQLWRPIGSILGREQSKFFPSIKTPTSDDHGDKKARVKLPPVGCWLHRSERSADASHSSEMGRDDPESSPTPSLNKETTISLPDCLNTSLSSDPVSEGNRSSTCTPPSSKNKDDGLTPTRVSTHESDAADITDLGHVFPWTQHYKSKANETWLSSSCPGDPSNRPFPEYQSAQPPYELEGCGAGLPYVHANSLTGFSNESEDTVVHFRCHELPAYADSVINLPVMHLDDGNVGMNELVVDHDIFGPVDLDIAAGVPLPASRPITPPVTTLSQLTQDIASLMPINTAIEAEHRQSDAHFYSEQALFSQSPVKPAKKSGLPRNEQRCEPIDIADFLKLGHAKQCWCDHCDNKTDSPSLGQEDVQWASSPTLTDQTCVGNDSSLSLILNHSESSFDSDSESEAPELLELFEFDANDADFESGKIETAEDEDWLVFSRSVPQSCRPSTSSSPLYLPSSPILHLQRPQRASTPTIIITTSSDAASAEDRAGDYVAVPPTTAPVATQTPVWHDMFPRRPSSAWKTGLAELSAEPVARGSAKLAEGSWRWGRQSEEEWWDWAVEEEC
jgi:hypothetical protein